MGQVTLSIQKLLLKLGDNMLNEIILVCDFEKIPSSMKNIVLPARIAHIVGYRRLNILKPETKGIPRIICDFLVKDHRYCRFFSILDETESDDGPPVETDPVDDLSGDGLSDGGRPDNDFLYTVTSADHIPCDSEVVARSDDGPPVDEIPPIIEDSQDDNEETETEKKQAANSKKPAKKPANGRKKRTAKKSAKNQPAPKSNGGES